MTSDAERPEPEVVRDGAVVGQGSQPDGRGRRSAPAPADRLTDGRAREWRSAWAVTERVPQADSVPGTAPGAVERATAGPEHRAEPGEATGPEGTAGPEETAGPEAVAGPDAPGPEQLRDLVCAARVVLFGFEGPLCRLFTPGRARQVAAAMAAWMTGSGLRDLGAVLGAGGAGDAGDAGDADDPTVADPHHLLTEVATRFPGSDLAAELADVLTREELAAVPAAWPTPFTDPLVRTWAAVGTRLAVTTTTSTAAVHAYLARRDLTACFAPHVHGRPPSHGAAPAASRLQRIQPVQPVHRVLNATGTPPSAALVIGSTPAALSTARTAGVPFLGYASGAAAAHALRAAGATVVGSMERVLEAVRTPHG